MNKLFALLAGVLFLLLAPHSPATPAPDLVDCGTRGPNHVLNGRTVVLGSFDNLADAQAAFADTSWVQAQMSEFAWDVVDDFCLFCPHPLDEGCRPSIGSNPPQWEVQLFGAGGGNFEVRLVIKAVTLWLNCSECTWPWFD